MKRTRRGSADGNPGGLSEPLFNASIHTLVWPGQTNGGSGSSYSWDSSHPAGNARTQEDFSGFANSAAILAYFSNSTSGGSINLDATTGVSSSSSMRIDWTDQGCLGASDANVGIQKRLGKMSDGIHNDIQNYSSTAKHWIITCQMKFGTGYLFYGRSGCARSGDQKIIVVYRDPNATHNKFTFHADNEGGRGCPISAYSSFNGQGLWDWGWDSSESDGSAPSCGSPIFPGVVNNGTLDPGGVGDNTWRRVTLEVRKESIPLAGDGLYRLWVGGTLKANYDGQDSGNVAFNKCYTGDAVGFADPVIFFGIFNAGPPQAQSCWMTDWQTYYVTGS